MDTVLRKKVSEIKTKRILLKQMHCIDVLDHMDCIYIAKKQRLKQVDHNDGQIRSNSEFLDIAPTYAGWAKQFLDALYETNQKYLADMLLPLEGYSPPISDNDLTPDEHPDPPNFPQNRSEAPPSYENTFPNMVANPNHRSYNSDQGEEMKNLQRKFKSNQLSQNLTESEAVPISEQSNADQMRLDSCSQSDNQTNETLSAFNFPNTTSFNNASRDTSTSFNNASRDTDSKSSYKAKNLNAV
uniref:Caspase recruitment domain-containing protein n=2 Tax=Ciona intestinalis TaxID=7719 RepID=H2Y3B7_CIOIN